MVGIGILRGRLRFHLEFCENAIAFLLLEGNFFKAVHLNQSLERAGGVGVRRSKVFPPFTLFALNLKMSAIAHTSQLKWLEVVESGTQIPPPACDRRSFSKDLLD